MQENAKSDRPHIYTGVACEQALLFRRAKRALRERASDGPRKGELATISHKFSFPPRKPPGLRKAWKLSPQTSRRLEKWQTPVKFRPPRARIIIFNFSLTNKNITAGIYLSVPELENSVFLDLVLLSITPVATRQLFLFTVLLYGKATQLHCQVDVSEFFYPVEFNRAKKPTLEGSAWTGLACVASVSNRVIARTLPLPRHSFFFCSCSSFLDEPREKTLDTQARTGLLNLSLLSLFSFSELNKALDTNEFNWWRVFIFLPQEL